jgi:hypothetical protein
MSDCPNFRHLLITRPDVLKARISFSKIPKWFTCEVIVPFVITRLALLLVGWLGFRLLPLPVAFPCAWEIGPDGNRHAVVDCASPTAYIWTSVIFFSCWGILGSIPRFDLVIFPLFIVLALIGARSRAFHLGYVVASSMLAALFMVMHSQWNWVA